jgi:uncharacterized membrane protein YphA (DoxX/SURF4 family)
MSARSVGYWTTTILIALAFLSGGAAYLLRADVPLRGMAELGYPAYFVTLLGIWKVLGGLAILAPRHPLLKEWAYAGIAFDLTGAAVSHAAVGQPVVKSSCRSCSSASPWRPGPSALRAAGSGARRCRLPGRNLLPERSL